MRSCDVEGPLQLNASTLDGLARDAALSECLLDLRDEKPSATTSACTENMRAVVPNKGCDPQDLVNFLGKAAKVWLRRASEEGIVPATFYAWYDEMAGQLCFSLIPGRPDVLPFGATVVLVATPSEIVQEVVTTRKPGFIPWNELTEVGWTEPALSNHSIRVWACTSDDAV